MKPYSSLAEARRSLTIQVLVLIIAIILLSLAGRLIQRNHFTMSMVLTYNTSKDISDDNIHIDWKDGFIPVTAYHVHNISDSNIHAKALDITMQPKRAGSATMIIRDKEGHILLKDKIYVDRFLTVFSRNTGDFTGDEAIIFSWILFYLVMAILTLLFFRRLKGPLANSYEAILACGVFTFSVIALIIEVPVYINHLRTPAFYPTRQWLSDVAAGGKYFTFYTAPLLLVFCILLIISNINLLRHERPRFANVLGLLLGLLMITTVTIYIMIVLGKFTMLPCNQGILLTAAINILGIIITYTECILTASVICGLRAARHVPSPDMDYILILGCGFRKDGSLPPLLRGRVDRAMEFWHRQKELTGKEAVIIPSGGQGRGEPMAEARAMYNYMISTGFPENAILLEDKSANTYQNMTFSKKLIESRNPEISDVKIAFSTTNYHVFRSGVWAGLAGLPAEGMGSKTKWWFWPNAFIRECVGLLQNRIIPETVLLCLLVSLFGFLSWVVFL